jgi:hypothetical protein
MLRIVACAVLIAGCAQLSAEPGNGKAAKETRQVSGFTAVELSGALVADITLGATTAVEVTGDENLLPLLVTEVKGDTLKVHTTKSVRPKLALAVHVVLPALKQVAMSGSCKATLAQVTGDKLALELSGSSALEASGAVRELAVDMSGSGEVHAAGLAAEAVKVGVSGSGTVEVAAASTLDVHVSGSATVLYHGHPKVTKSVSGSATIEAR